MRNYNIESDLKQEQFQTLKLVQGDRGNKIKINVYEDGQPVSLTGCSVTAKYKRADGEIINDGVIENIHDNSFDAVMDSSITKVAGTLKMLFTIEKDDVKVSTFLLLADVRESIGENTGSSGGNTGGGSGEVTIDLSNYYKKIETYSKNQIDARFKDIAKKTIVEGNKIYLGKADGTKLDEGTELPIQEVDLSSYVKKENGKSLITDAERNKLTNLENYDDSSIKNDIQTQKARIDSLATLKEGSTTGDAELIDARIDNEGVVHSNLHNAITFQINNINNFNYKKKIFNWKQGTYNDNSNIINITDYKLYTDMEKVPLGSKITIKITDTTKYKYRLFIFNKDKEFVRQTIDFTDETSLIMNYPYFALVIKQQNGQTIVPSASINDGIYCEIEKYNDDVYTEIENGFYTGNSGGFTKNTNYNSVYFLAKQGRTYQLYPSVRKLCVVENGEYVYYDVGKQNYSFLAEQDFICRLSYAKMNDETQQKTVFQIVSYNNCKNINNDIDDRFYSYNLFDKSKSVAGYIGNTAGDIYSNNRYKTSDFIQVYSGATYIISSSVFEILFYDANKTPIASTYAKMDICGYSFNAPQNAGYVRFSYLNVFENYVQLIKNDNKKLFPYQNYGGFGNLNSVYKNENKLSGKTLLTVGDSIMEGNGNSNVGIGEIICSMNQMQQVELSKGGATIGFRNDYTGDDKTHLQKQQNIQYQVDYAIANYTDIDCILIDGSTNDIDKKAILGLGDMLNGYDTTSAVLTTFSGGLESIFYKLKTAYPKAKIIYIRPHNIGSRPYQLQVDYGNRAKNICKKWSVYCVDLFENSGLNTNLEQMIPFTNNNDQCHPNHEGYINYYIPLIENALTSLF